MGGRPEPPQVRQQPEALPRSLCMNYESAN